MSRLFLAAIILGCSLSAQTAPPKKGDPRSHPAGQAEDVRGTMSLHEISQKTGVPVTHFQKALNLDKSIDLNKPVRDWIHSKGMSMQDVREAAKSYKSVKK